VAKRGGGVARQARLKLEAETGKQLVSPLKALPAPDFEVNKCVRKATAVLPTLLGGAASGSEQTGRTSANFGLLVTTNAQIAPA
jgi:hypothetical protein